MLSGGKDGKVKSWNYSNKLYLQSELAELAELLSVICFPVAIDMKFNGSILIATDLGHIVEIRKDMGSIK